MAQQRLPSFVSESKEAGLTESFGTLKYLWGNTPAIDVINLVENEEKDHEEALHILFAGIDTFLVEHVATWHDISFTNSTD